MPVSKAAVRGISLEQASKIVDVALAEAQSRKLRPMTIAVLDGGGDLVAYKREDHTGIHRYQIVDRTLRDRFSSWVKLWIGP